MSTSQIPEAQVRYFVQIFEQKQTKLLTKKTFVSLLISIKLIIYFTTELDSHVGDQLQLKNDILDVASLQLCDHLKIAGDFLVQLKTCGVIKDGDAEEIKSEKTSMTKVDALLSILHRRAIINYRKFVVALKNEHTDLYKEIRRIQSQKIQGKFKLSKRAVEQLQSLNYELIVNILMRRHSSQNFKT